ncbi:MAG: hypothetical protein AAF670_21060 [Planctomycetota bacterium]
MILATYRAASRQVEYFGQTPMAQIGLLVLLLMSTGCSRFVTTYGDSKGFNGDRSLNGFGALRDTIETISSRIQTRDLYRLSKRSRDNDAIVWIPSKWPPANEVDAIEWMDEWMKSGGKTLVFVVPDGGSTDAYWRLASSSAPAEDSLEYRRRLARQVNQRLISEANRKDVDVSDWFRAVATRGGLTLDDFRSASFDLQEASSQATAASPNGASTSADSAEAEEDASDQRMLFEPLDEADPEGLPEMRHVTILASTSRMSWDESRVIVVAGGGLLTNFAMTQRPAQMMATDIAESIDSRISANQETLTVGFLESNETPIPISKAAPNAPVATGMEALTTWPLSLISIHALFLGIVMCLMLMPIFGRPRSVRYNDPTRFGNHLDAMATLMHRGRHRDAAADQRYARERISRYMRQVRGEHGGPWVLPEPDATLPSNESPS